MAALVGCVADPEWQVRAAAVRALGDMAVEGLDQQQLLAIGACLADPCEEVRKVALQATRRKCRSFRVKRGDRNHFPSLFVGFWALKERWI